MSAQELDRLIQSFDCPFWLQLTSGEQIACQQVLHLDGATIGVITGGNPWMIFLHRVKGCSSTPVTLATAKPVR